MATGSPHAEASAPEIKLIPRDVKPAKMMKSAPVAAVISSPNLGVLAVAAAGVLCTFCCLVDTLPEQCLRRRPVQISFSRLFLELISYYVNAVKLHVHAPAVLARCATPRAGFR